MSKFINDGFTKVAWVTTIASAAAPTVAELTAGVDITGYLTKEGLVTPANQNMVNQGTLATTFDAQGIGTWGGAPIELTGYRDNVDDDAYEAFAYGDDGYLVIRRGIAVGTAWTAAQKAEVWPASAHQPLNQPPATNENAKFKVVLAATSEPKLAATVAA